MALKNLCRAGLLSLSLLAMIPANAELGLGQTIQIETYLQSIIGAPTWTLILRNEDTGEIVPYMYDIVNYNSFFIALSYARSYRVVASTMQFQYATFQNFCHLEGGTISNESYIIRITGSLSPDRHAFRCRSSKFKNYSLPIAASTES
jgi:hypothetical protein